VLWDELAHAEHSVNLLDAQPVKDVRHECLESHVIDTGDPLGMIEVVGRPVVASLSRIVNH